MTGIVTPPVIVEPFGINAASPNITLPIPVASQIGTTPGAASYNDGFPPVTMEAVVAGGIPPFGQDFNGILYTVTASLAAIQAGQPWLYNTDIVAAIGGYPVGTILGMADGSGIWLNQVAANVSDPSGGGSNGWVPIYSYGATVLSGLSNSNIVLTPQEAAKTFIYLEGALTGNIQIIFPTGVDQEWLICNECSGGFTITAKTAAGTGVVIPAGTRSAPTGIFSDAVSIFLSVSPLAVPISINPNPLSLAERDNSGYLYATYFNQNSALPDPVLSIGAIFVQQPANDGFLRKSTPANFISQLNLATTTAVAAAIATALATYSTTTAMNAAIAAAVAPKANSANPTLTGTVGVPTRTPGDSTANAASTAFLQAALAALVSFSVAAKGSANIGGFIINWGLIASTGGAVVETFFTAYPHACFAIAPGAVGANATINTSAPSASNSQFTCTNGANGTHTSYISVGW